jgi:heptose I phosphotransferase
MTLVRPFLLPKRAVRRVVRSSPDWDAALGPGWADRIMDVATDDRKHEKQGRSIVRWAVTESLTVYLKRHFQLPRIAGWLARLFPRRAWSPGLQEWNHIAWAQRAGLPVPRAVAAGEFRGPGGRLQSFLAVEELRDMLALHEAVPIAAASMNSRDFARWKSGIITELARVCRELHSRRAFHRDLYLCHFFVPEASIEQAFDSWHGRVVMIDLHRLARFPFTWPVWHTKDLAQFLFSSFDVTGITPRDRLRFWKLYCGGDWAGWKRPSILGRFVRLKAANYLRHNRKHDLAVPRKD